MPSIGTFIADLYGSTLGNVLSVWRRRSRSVDASVAYGSGQVARLRASVFGLNTIINDFWVAGVLEVGERQVTWHGGYFRAGHGVKVTPESFTATVLRPVEDRESWAVSKDCVVLVGEFNNRRIEIAALVDDMSIVLDALGANHLLE